MQGLVAVALGGGNPVAEAALLRGVETYQNGVDKISLTPFGLRIRGLVEYDADGVEVINLLERHILGAHLEPNRIRRLDAFFYAERDIRLLQCALDGSDEFIDLGIPFRHVAADTFGNIPVCIGFLETKPDVFHLRFDSVQAETVGEGNEYEHCLAQDLVPLVLGHVLDGPAVVQAVCQFYEHHADVVVESEQDSLEILSLYALGGCHGAALVHLVVEHGLDLGQTVDKQGDVVPEEIAYIVDGIVGIFHHVVKKGGRDGFVTETYLFADNLGHLDGVQDVWLSGTAPHVPVCLIRKIERLADHGQFFFVTAAHGSFGIQPVPLLANQIVVLYREFGNTAHKAFLYSSWSA